MGRKENVYILITIRNVAEFLKFKIEKNFNTSQKVPDNCSNPTTWNLFAPFSGSAFFG